MPTPKPRILKRNWDSDFSFDFVVMFSDLQWPLSIRILLLVAYSEESDDHGWSVFLAHI